jgi:hypothetical protein
MRLFTSALDGNADRLHAPVALLPTKISQYFWRISLGWAPGSVWTLWIMEFLLFPVIELHSLDRPADTDWAKPSLISLNLGCKYFVLCIIDTTRVINHYNWIQLTKQCYYSMQFINPFLFLNVSSDENQYFIETCRDLKQKFLRKTNILLPFDTTWARQKKTPPTILRCRGNMFTEPLPSNDRRIHRPTDSLSIKHGPHIKRRIQKFFYYCVYSLPRKCVYLVVA